MSYDRASSVHTFWGFGMKRGSTSRAARLSALMCVAFGLAFASFASAAPTVADQYVALGDSFSSGVGTGSYTLSASCRRGVYAYPWLISQQRPNTSLTFVACSGAATSDLMASQIQSVTGDTDIVSVTIGGNDIGFAALILQCTLADCSAALDNTRSTLGSFLTSRLDTVYAAIESRAPTASVVVLGYPRMFSSIGCFGTFGISSTERTKANQLADALDQLIGARATSFGFTYKSAIAPFMGHAVCSFSPWLNGLNLFNTMESYHPNRNGNSLGYAPLVRSVVG
jgi:lysophospholipase L1-like esterase